MSTVPSSPGYLGCRLEIRTVPAGRTKSPDFRLHETEPAVAVEVPTNCTREVTIIALGDLGILYEDENERPTGT